MGFNKVRTIRDFSFEELKAMGLIRLILHLEDKEKLFVVRDKGKGVYETYSLIGEEFKMDFVLKSYNTDKYQFFKYPN